MSYNCLKFSKNFATRHWRPEVTINVTAVSKHSYEIKILPIIRTCAWKDYTNASLIYGGGGNAKQNCIFGKNGT
jgi:hypothetical protein